VAAAVSAGRRAGALIQGSPSRTFPARNRHFDQRAGWGRRPGHQSAARAGQAGRAQLSTGLVPSRRGSSPILAGRAPGSSDAPANGVYTDLANVAALGPWSLLRLRTRALLMVSPPNTYAADWSAVVVHDLPTAGEPPAVPSVLRPRSCRSGSNRTINGRTRFAAVPDTWLGDHHGVARFSRPSPPSTSAAGPVGWLP